MGILASHCKDPYKLISTIWNLKRVLNVAQVSRVVIGSGQTTVSGAFKS